MVVLLLSSMALFERFAEVVGPLLAVPAPVGSWLLFLPYLAYLIHPQPSFLSVGAEGESMAR